MRTLFGTIQLASPRWWSCSCGHAGARTFSPIARLLDERSTPELRYRANQVRGVDVVSARRTSAQRPVTGRTHDPSERVLAARSPRSPTVSMTSCPRNGSAAWRRPTRPGSDNVQIMPLVVAIDGGFIHSSEQRSRRDGWFQAIVGSVTHALTGSVDGSGSSRRSITRPKARLVALLHAQGMRATPADHVPYRRRRRRP